MIDPRMPPSSMLGLQVCTSVPSSSCEFWGFTITHYPSFISVAVIKTPWSRVNWRRWGRGIFGLHVLVRVHREGKSGQEQRPQRNTSDWLTLHGLLSLFSYITSAQSWHRPPPKWAGPPTSSTKWDNALQIYQEASDEGIFLTKVSLSTCLWFTSS